MIPLEAAMKDALDARPDVAALACMDGRAGLLLGMFVKGDVPTDMVELAALSAPDLCSAPSLADGGVEPDACPDAFVASEDWVHAFARVPERPELVVMGLAQRGTNVTLLRAWLGEVAGRVGQVS